MCILYLLFPKNECNNKRRTNKMIISNEKYIIICDCAGFGVPACRQMVLEIANSIAYICRVFCLLHVLVFKLWRIFNSEAISYKNDIGFILAIVLYLIYCNMKLLLIKCEIFLFLYALFLVVLCSYNLDPYNEPRQ